MEHNYSLNIKWTGNKGTGTSAYRAYDRQYTISAKGKTDILGSSDPVFRGDKTKYNPEEMLLAALSACHMLSYLHLCAEAGVIVVDYSDDAIGTMTVTENGRSGKFQEVILNPVVTVTEHSMAEKANELHKQANEMCFIANSCNFPVHHRPASLIAGSVR